jgi:hypothetical protein
MFKVTGWTLAGVHSCWRPFCRTTTHMLHIQLHNHIKINKHWQHITYVIIWIWGSHSSVYEEDLLDCNEVYFRGSLTFLIDKLQALTASTGSLFGLLSDPGDVGDSSSNTQGCIWTTCHCNPEDSTITILWQLSHHLTFMKSINMLLPLNGTKRSSMITAKNVV